jgi:hypothetical protein
MITRNNVTLPEYQYYGQRLHAQNPVDRVTVIPHEPVEFTGSTTSSGDIFTALRQLREREGADPWQFYYGIIDPCDDGPSFSGVASVPNHGSDGLPDKSDSNQRTGWGRYRNDGRHAGTFVHELGHQQGRRHVDCGGPAGPDPNYPNATGDIAVFGWDIFSTSSIWEPNDKDYMSYCNPSWVSEYGWNLAYPWIAEISRWPSEHVHGSPTPMLYATIQPGRVDQFWTGKVTGTVSVPASVYSVSFYSGASLLATQYAERDEVPEDPHAFFLNTPLPQTWNQVTHVVWTDGLSRTAVPRARIK